MTLLDLRNGDCLEVLQDLEPNSVDSIVTDPPYGLSFMGRKWDYDVPSVNIWIECLRVLKPGGYLLSFAGTRTQHRMAVNIEDAGFEIRDMIAWVYGSGFPKSHNIGKKLEGWDGWGTALKPALEPVTVARKPFKGTVVNNVLEHGTGAINIDGCRIETEHKTVRLSTGQNIYGGNALNNSVTSQTTSRDGDPRGRWPANLIHDGSDEVTELFPETVKGGSLDTSKIKVENEIFGKRPQNLDAVYARDSGSAARYFYCAKANKKDRDEGNNHPTVKPTDLMAYLCRLVTPPGGTVLDPFMGSGSTGKAAMREGFSFIGIERDPDYYAIAQQRVTLKTDGQMDLLA